MSKKGKKCSKCDRWFKRKECDYCLRTKRWGRIEVHKKRQALFPKRITADLERYVINAEISNPSLYIHGLTGAGKTLHAAQLLLNLYRQSYIEQKRETFCFVKVSSLMLEFKDVFGETGGETRIIQKYTTYTHLVLDGLADEKVTDWGFKMLLILIDRRYEEMKGLIVTANLSLADLSDSLNDTRLTSRLERMCKPYKLSGIDNRRK